MSTDDDYDYFFYYLPVRLFLQYQGLLYVVSDFYNNYYYNYYITTTNTAVL